MFRLIKLPTHSTKEGPPEEDEIEAERDSELTNHRLRSVEESLVLLQALRQSRQTWLTSAFLKFSTKSRTGKGGDIWQPPHTIRFRGRCDLEIGPHVFYTTSIYEVIYQSYSVPAQPSLEMTTSTRTLSNSHSAQPSISQNSIDVAGTAGNSQSANAVVSSLNGSVPITNELIAEVNAAASSDPALAELLRVAAAGNATKEQLHTLGVRMQALADVAKVTQNSSITDQAKPQSNQTALYTAANVPPPSLNSATTRGTSTPTAVLSLRPTTYSLVPGDSASQQRSYQSMQVMHKDPDVVIEFFENSSDRWLLPKDLVLYEKVQRWDNNNTLADIIFSTIFPFEGTPKPPESQEPKEEEAAPPAWDYVHPITLRFFNVPLAIWNLFSSAANDSERTKRVRAAIDAKLDKAAPRTYLQHRVSDGALLSQLQASAADRYPMKGIKPLPGATGGTKKRTINVKDNPDGSAQKRRRAVSAKKVASRTGTCDICKRASVVLAPESLYCPPCTKKVASGDVLPTPPVKPNSGSGDVAANVAGQDSNTNTQANPSPLTPAASIGMAPGASGTQPSSSSSSKTPTKQRKPRKTAAPPTFKTPTTPASYTPGMRPPLPSYYTWQPGTHYAYYQHPSVAQSGRTPTSLPVMAPYPSIYAQAGQAAVQQVYPSGIPPVVPPQSASSRSDSAGEDDRVANNNSNHNTEVQAEKPSKKST